MVRSIVLLCWFLLPLFASAEPKSTPHVRAQLLSEEEFLLPGKSNWVGLQLEMQPHWHTYWKFPGDSGLPTTVKWQLPEGWKISDVYWPLPSRIFMPPLVNFGFEGEALLGFMLTPPAGSSGSYELQAKASWLVCKEECIPESVDLHLRVSVKDGQPKKRTVLFEKLRQQQAVPPPQGSFVATHMEGKRIGLAWELEEDWLSGTVDFFPLVAQLVTGAKRPEVVKEKGRAIVWLDKAEPFANQEKELPGILVVGEGHQRRAYEVRAPLPVVGAETVVAAEDTTVWLAILFAFLGGVLLNLMPCVFPVLGIKVLSLVSQGGEDRWHARKHGKVYGLGVLVSFWVLTGILLLLRSAGQEVGWGFQLQQPGFVLVLILLFSLMAANLGGFFEFTGRFMGLGSNLAAREGYLGSFFTGILAVVVATPCTAPFMGTAIGVVLTQPAWAVLAVFTALAIGLAAPFLFLSYQPNLVKSLPRPGPWMERVKEFFAFPLAATVLWLFWVLGIQIGIDGLVVAMAGLVLVFFSLWVGRRFAGKEMKVLGWCLLLGGCLLTVSSLRWRGNDLGASGAWQVYSDQAVAEALAAKKNVFVDFTAAWCLTCQVNKSLVLERPAMKSFFLEKEVVLFRADWTNSDPHITKALERYGRIGVPLYLAFPGGREKPEILPQILTEKIVREVFP